MDAVAEAVKEIPYLLLISIGDGPERENLVEKAKHLNIDDNLVWAWQKTPEEVPSYYKIMDVVVVPSLFEGFGLSAAEAMAAGKPVVASNIDGLKEVVDHEKTGYLVPVGESKIIATYLLELLSNPNSIIVSDDLNLLLTSIFKVN